MRDFESGSTADAPRRANRGRTRTDLEPGTAQGTSWRAQGGRRSASGFVLGGRHALVRLIIASLLCIIPLIVTVDAAASMPLTPNIGGDGAMLSTGRYFGCQLITGRVRCWGSGYYREVDANLGDMGSLGTGVDSRVLGAGSDGVAVAYNRVSAIPFLDFMFSADPVASISSCAWHSCALFASGNVACWGRNGAGELGQGLSGTANSVGTASPTSNSRRRPSGPSPSTLPIPSRAPFFSAALSAAGDTGHTAALAKVHPRTWVMNRTR